MPRIRVNNTIAPWMPYDTTDRAPDDQRSSQINALRNTFRSQSPVSHYLRRYRENLLDSISSNILREAEGITNHNKVFPPVRRTMDRIWRDYVLPETYSASFDFRGNEPEDEVDYR